MLNIVSGKLNTPVKMVFYGVEGVGKTTFASKFPRPLFIDAEAGTRRLNVDRLGISNWTEFLSVLRQLISYKNKYDTIVLDTVDALEYLAIKSVCDKFKIPALGGNNDFGKSYSALASEFGEMIVELDALNDVGFHIVCLAHAQVVRVETVGEEGAYDRYQLKLEKKTSAKIKEWTEFLAFMNFETKVIEQKGKKNKAVGGERIAYCEHSLYWDAKNRDTDGIPIQFSIEMRDGKHLGWEAIRNHVEANTFNQEKKGEANYDVEEERESVRQLKAVLEANDMTMGEAMECIYSHKHYVRGTLLENIDDEYITGKLIPAIPTLKTKIKQG